jgi:hypothetical protein
MNRLVIISLFLFIFPLSFAFAQTEENLIDVQFKEFGSGPVYSVVGQKLKFKDLSAIMDNFPEGKTYMELARKNKINGAVLLGVGYTGMFIGFFLFLEGGEFANAIFWPSFAIGLVGAGLLGSYRSNVQKAVNGYNQMLYKSRTGMTKLDFRISPLASGLVLNF